MTTSPNAPFSRRVALSDISDAGITRTFEANEHERAALARELGLPAIPALVAELRVRPHGRRFDVTGHVRATVVQTCSVTLEPFEAALDEPVEISFAEDPERAGPGLDGELPDPVEGGGIDLGRIAAEFLALGLDPYPRKPGVAFDPGQPGLDAPVSPFDALRRLAKDG